MTIILIALVAIVGILLTWTIIRMNGLKRDVVNLRTVVDNQENYMFLIDQTFEVKESNVKLADDQPHIFGNVIHCKNTRHAVRCGESDACSHCPVRFVISKSFERNDDFKNLEASMELSEGSELSDVDVSVDGNFVCIKQEPHMVINVKNMTTCDGNTRPKILFLSENAALFDQVRMALGISFRVLNVDTEHQALHRLLHADNYNFCAVITDAHFYHASSAVSIILAERKKQLPLFVFANEEERVADPSVNYLDTDITEDELMKRLVACLK